MSDIPKAEFYDCSDAERLHHTSPEEAVEAFVDDFFTRDCDVSAVIRGIGNVTLGCYQKETVTPKWAERSVKKLLDDLGELWAESEYADAEDHPEDADAIEAARGHMKAAVDAYLSKVDVWSYHRFKEVVLTPEQVETMMREYCPEWFEPVVP